MKIFRGKNLIVTLATLICVLAVSILIPVLHNESYDENVEVVAHDLANIGGMLSFDRCDEDKVKEVYNKYDTFEITDSIGIQHFSIMLFNDFDFAGKTVNLKTDIGTYEGGAPATHYLTTYYVPFGVYLKLRTGEDETGLYYGGFGKFCGVFDGCGHSIDYGGAVEETAPDDFLATMGLFGVLGGSAIVKNVRVVNVGLSAYNSNWVDFNFGGIAGTIDGDATGVTIENCSVEDIIFSSKENGTSEERTLFGGIVGDNDGKVTIKNCYVKGMSCKTIDGGHISSATVLGPSRGTNFTLENCVATDFDNNSLYISGGSVKNVHSQANKTTGLDCDSKSGTTGTLWYYHENYNNGYPYLRQFIGWETINFVAPENGSVSTSSILIPEPYTSSILADKDQSTNRTLEFFGESVYAYPNTGYKFEKWTYDEETLTFTASFKLVYVSITFDISNIQNLSFTSYVNNGYSPDVNEGDISVGNELKIEVDPYTKENKHKKIIFSFTHVEGVTMQFIYEVTNDSYCIPSIVINGEMIIISENTTKIINTTTTISVNTEQKQYDIGLGYGIDLR